MSEAKPQVHVPRFEAQGNVAFGLAKGHKTKAYKQAPRQSRKKGVRFFSIAYPCSHS